MTYQAKLTDTGDILLPAALQQEFDLQPGDRLIVEREDGKLVLKSYFQHVEDVSRAVRESLTSTFTVADFIAERRAEAARE
jgi:AbrB family transcriptional regulator, stage V sporulation protein T